MDDFISSKKPFAFVSHVSHSKPSIEPILFGLLELGHALFVDRPHELSERFRPHIADGRLIGIEGGVSFNKRVFDAILHAAIFVPVISEEHAVGFATSANCRKELRVALKYGVEILPVYLGEQWRCQEPFESREALFQWPVLDQRQWLPAHPENTRFDFQIADLSGRFCDLFEVWKAKQEPKIERDGWERQRTAADQWFDGAVRREINGIQFVLVPGQDEGTCFYISSDLYLDRPASEADLIDFLKRFQKDYPGIALPSMAELHTIFPADSEGVIANPFHLAVPPEPNRYWTVEDLAKDRDIGWILLTYDPI